jgi:hypothetical protein
MASGGGERDPVSVLFDGAARSLLRRAYASPGTWVRTRVADPGKRAQAFAAERGIVVTGPDNPSVRGGKGLDCRTRWVRGFVRALYYQHKWFSDTRGRPFRTQRRPVARSASALRIEVGRHVPASPQFDPDHPGRGGFPPGRAVRVKLDSGGKAKDRAVRRLPDSARIWTDAGQPAGRFSDPSLRDW